VVGESLLDVEDDEDSGRAIPRCSLMSRIVRYRGVGEYCDEAGVFATWFRPRWPDIPVRKLIPSNDDVRVGAP
jgi:hypothetical protein